MGILEYLFKGFIHYLSLLFGLLDFIDLQIMFAIIIILFIVSLINKDVRKSILAIFKPMIKVILNPFGLIMFITVISYYVYITINFEENITPILFIFTLCLFFKDYFKSYLNISSISVKTTIKDFSFSVILLIVYQLVLMFENGNLEYLKAIILLLIFIPIFSIVIIIFKYLICFEVTRIQWENKTSLSINEILKLYNYVLFKTRDYYYIQSINNALTYNKKSNYEEIKKITINNIEKIKLEKINKKKTKEKYIITKMKKIMLVIWLLNIVALIILIVDKRFSNIDFGFLYYLSLVIVYIFFWADLMKEKEIENSYDFVTYMFIYIFVIIVIALYTRNFNNDRLSDLTFVLPIFVFFHIKTYKKPFPNIIGMPKLTKNNFFGVGPNNFDTKK